MTRSNTSLSFSMFTKVWPLFKYLCDITLAVSLLFSGFLFSCSNKCATYSNHFRRNCNKSTPRKRYLLGLANHAVALCCGANYSLGSASRHQIKYETVICPSVWPLYATKSYCPLFRVEHLNSIARGHNHRYRTFLATYWVPGKRLSLINVQETGKTCTWPAA